MLSASRQRSPSTFRDANFRTAVEIRNFGAVSRSRDAVRSLSTAAQRTLHRIAASLGRRAGARSLLTSRTNNACEPTRYAEIRAPKDVTYDTGRPARTVHIFVGDEPLIVAPRVTSGPGMVRGSLTNRTPGNRDRVISRRL